MVLIEGRWLDGGPRKLPSAGRNFGLALDRRCDGIDDFRRYLDFVFRAWLGSVVLGGDLSDLEKKLHLYLKVNLLPKSC